MRSHVLRYAAVLCGGSLWLACATAGEPADASTQPDARPPADAAQLPDAAPRPDAAPPPDAPVVIDADPGCILTEGFESGAVPPPSWSVVDFNHNDTWEAWTVAPRSGLFKARVNYDEALGQQNEVLISPEVTCSNMTLTFWMNGSYYWAIDPFTNYDGALWAVVGAWDEGATDDVLITNTLLADLAVAQGGEFTTWAWYQISYPIPASLNDQPIRFAWQYYGSDGAELAIDDVQLN